MRAVRILVLALIVAGCGTSDAERRPVAPGDDARAAAGAGAGPALGEPAASSGYSLDRTRALPSDVAEQVSYNEGGDPGCQSLLNGVSRAFQGVHTTGEDDDVQGPLARNDDPFAPVTGLNDPFEFCTKGIRKGRPFEITHDGPSGRTVVRVGARKRPPAWVLLGDSAVSLFLDHVRKRDIGRHRISIRQGGRTVTGRYQVEATPPTIRLSLITDVRAGQPVKVLGSGFRARQRVRLLLYNCSERSEGGPIGRLQAVTALTAREDGSLHHAIRTRTTDTGCFLVRADVPGARDGWLQNRFSIQGGRPSRESVAVAERGGCKGPIQRVQGTSCAQANKLAESFGEGLTEGNPCIGQDGCFTSDDYFRYECGIEAITVICVGVSRGASEGVGSRRARVEFDVAVGTPGTANSGGTCEDLELAGQRIGQIEVEAMTCDEARAEIVKGGIGAKGYQRYDGWTCENGGTSKLLVTCERDGRTFMFAVG